MANKKMTVAELVAAGFTAEQIKLLSEAGQVKKEAAPKVPLASVVRYTTKGKGETGVYLRVCTNGYRGDLYKLNAGSTLTAEGRSKMVSIANSIADLLDNPTVSDLNSDKE